MIEFLLGFYCGGVFVVSLSSDMARPDGVMFSPTLTERILVGLTWPYHVAMQALDR